MLIWNNCVASKNTIKQRSKVTGIEKETKEVDFLERDGSMESKLFRFYEIVLEITSCMGTF